ncbi:MAG: hypothetical protein GY714_12490 [Desulfobacterales bacterium]|nr:hypothetical protein [Desulfobacterales bacterium]
MSQLLEEIIKVTELKGAEPEVIRVSSDEDFRSLIKNSSSSESDKSVDNDYKPDDREMFIYEMHQDLFDQATIKFNQMKHLKQKDCFNWTDVKSPELKLFKFIDSFRMNIKNGSLRFLEAKLISIKPADVRTATFLLASSQSKKTIENLLINFIRAEDKYLPEYVVGLKYCISKDISDYLTDILTTVRDSIKHGILDILLFRRETKLPHTIQFNDNNLQEKVLLLNFDINSKGTVINLSGLNPSFRVMFKMLVAGNDKPIEIIEDMVVNNSVTPELLILYASSGDADITFLKKAFESSDFEIRKAFCLSLAILGTIDSIESLIELVNQEELKEIVHNSLSIAISDFQDKDPTNKWQEVRKQKLRISSDRVRRGDYWSHETLLKDIKNPFSTPFERKNAWRELMIAKNIYIPFETDWLTDKQEKAISEIEQCLR